MEWIDYIPGDWKTEKLKNIFSFGKGLPITKDNLVEKGIPVISYGQIHSKINPGTKVIDDLIRYVSEDYLTSNPESLVDGESFNKTISAGTWVIPELELRHGENTVSVAGEGITTFSYREGRL